MFKHKIMKKVIILVVSILVIIFIYLNHVRGVAVDNFISRSSIVNALGIDPATNLTSPSNNWVGSFTGNGSKLTNILVGFTGNTTVVTNLTDTETLHITNGLIISITAP